MKPGTRNSGLGDGGTIVVGFDATEPANDALALGAQLAHRLESRLLVAAALEWTPLVPDPADFPDVVRHYFAEIEAAARERLPDGQYEWRELAVTATAGLHRLAEIEHADLIVVGSTHRGAVGRVLPGAVGESLLHGAPCAVAIAPRGYAAIDGRLHAIAAAVDGSEEAELALELTREIAGRLGGELTVLTVASNVSGSPFAAYWPSGLGDYQSLEDDAKREVLDAAVRAVNGNGAGARLLHGEPADALAHASAEFDLLCIGSRGYGPLRRTFVGSTAAHVARNAACPVLVAPRGATGGGAWFEKQTAAMAEETK